MGESPLMYSQGLARSTLLLESPLAAGARSAPATAAAGRGVVVSKKMLGVPMNIGALGARQRAWAQRAVTKSQPWGRRASEFGQQSVKLVKTK